MFGNEDEKQNYEGLFAPEPQEKRHDWMNGGSIERHASAIDLDTVVVRDAFGNVVRVEKRW
jgi:hypothetical protein